MAEQTKSDAASLLPTAEQTAQLASSKGESTPSGPRLLPSGFYAFSPQNDDEPTSVTTSLRPLTSAVLTIRIIKSFPFRASRNLVLDNLDLTTLNVKRLKEIVKVEIGKRVDMKTVRSAAGKLDTMKVYTHAHFTKTSNLIINLDRPEWVLDGDKEEVPLADLGCQNETELSLFNRQEYEEFLKDPKTEW
ncbi:hypothetical protein IE81DRAFT_319326 [Ceraceosorus guamensis]|uniref:Cytoplasmic protein n=1 Tax=Ceraceosorus guamensis TaxID=1522189 RepID=A0A316WA88_9BASI|nr:hypothetical protein IE81DRAFT_319326 [Ceraceosorus guamensis]PWN46414.1 hypothetical protein IE81DRAFT_319326 [Ceraceosorus guamensis]